MVARLGYALLLMVLCHVGATSAAAELALHLDRDRIGEGETVQITLTYNGEQDFEPDISVFERDFELLGQSRSHHTRIVNGHIGVRQILKLNLAPKRTGRLLVPAVHFDGVRSAERVLQVDAASEMDPSSRTHFIEVDVSTREPWVQQQVIYRVRIYQRTPVIDGSLSEPVADGVTLERLGSDRSYREARDGAEWDVLERRYALFPQRSGNVSLEAVRLLARVAADGNESGSFFNRQTRQIRLRGPTVDLSVKAAPSDTAWWLPATTLNLTANWLDAASPRVGDPVTLELITTAHGTQAAQLPELAPADHAGAKIYPGQSETGHRALASGLVSQRRVRYQIVPTRVGELVLDPIEMDWFSTPDGVAQRASVAIPPLVVAAAVANALPGLDAEPGAERSAAEERNPGAPLAPDRPPLAGSQPTADPDAAARARVFDWLAAQRRHLPLIAVLAGGIALLAVVLWLWRGIRRARRRGPQAALRRLSRHMRVGHRDGCQRALIEWAMEIWVAPPRSLPAIADRLRADAATADLAKRVQRLDQYLHGDRDGDWRDLGLARALRRIRREPDAATVHPTDLPSLGAAWADTVKG